MANDPGPTVLRVQYHSDYAPHTADFHTREWIPATVGHVLGSVPRWSDDTSIDVNDMLVALLGKVANFMPTTVVYDGVTVLTNDAPGEILVPRVSATFTGLAGSAATPGYSKAVQTTVTFRCVGGGTAKIVMLDSGSFGNFDTTRGGAFAGDLDDLLDEFGNELNAWCGNDNTRPVVPLGAFKTLNEKLRKAYRET